MEGLTLSEMASLLGVPQRTIERRVQRAGIKPLTHEAIYPPDTIDRIKDIKRGRPPKPPKPPKQADSEKPAGP
jgi:hypothetical protein